MKLRQKLASTALSLTLLSGIAITGVNAQTIGSELVFMDKDTQTGSKKHMTDYWTQKTWRTARK